jgi:hypothetical protein
MSQANVLECYPPVCDTAKVVLSGFSYDRIRDIRPGEPVARVEHLYDILNWFGVAPGTTVPNEADTCLTWYPRSPYPTPSARFDHGMAYQAGKQRVVLFGGIGGPPYLGPYLDDTWVWNDNTWQQYTGSPHPSARGGNQMAYHAAHNCIVLFGGFNAAEDTVYGDTWEFGENWWQPTLAHSPPPRFAHGMAYDAARQTIVLFGGQSSTGSWLNDTWEWGWNGVHWDWVERTPAHQPPPRTFFGGNGLAYDGARGVVVLFGGSQGGSGFLNDTWEWDGTDWTQRFPLISPSARDGHALAYVPGAHVLLFGGHNTVFHQDTWSWDGQTWTQLASPCVPPASRYRHALVYDAARSRPVLFGGWAFGTPFSDTWTWQFGSCVEGRPTEVHDTPVLANTLYQNYPNPFNPVTTIRFALERRSHVRIAVYDVTGRLVTTLVDEVRNPGEYTDVKWDGTNASGNPVATGVYFYRLVSDDFKQTRKMILIK